MEPALSLPPRAAITWVRVYYKTDECGLIRAQIRCKSLLDLLTGEHFEVLEATRLRLAQYQRKPVDQIRHAAVLSFLWAARAIDSARLIAGHQGSRIHADSRLAGPFEVILCIFEPMNIVVTDFADCSTGRSVG